MQLPSPEFVPMFLPHEPEDHIVPPVDINLRDLVEEAKRDGRLRRDFIADQLFE